MKNRMTTPQSRLIETYRRQPIAFVRGEGCWLEDEDGVRYLDGVAGVAVNTLGHCHSELVKAISEQAALVLHTSNLYRVPLQEQLAERLCTLSGMDAAFFCNSGLEANEAAIKIARKYGHDRGIESPVILVMEGAFHGRSLATLSASANHAIHVGFEPLLEGFVRVPFNNIDVVERLVASRKDVVAILVEPVQGEGGINVGQKAYLQALREICSRAEVLLLLDEVQSGVGRTGRWFGFQHAELLPDVVTMAKGLGSGVPIGCCLVRGAARSVFGPGNHGSTFGGNPLAMRAGLTTLEVVERDELLTRATVLGERMRTALGRVLANDPRVKELRGVGLMTGIEFHEACGDLVALARERRLLINVTAGNVVRLVPPLVISEAEVDELVLRFRLALDAWKTKDG